MNNESVNTQDIASASCPPLGSTKCSKISTTSSTPISEPLSAKTIPSLYSSTATNGGHNNSKTNELRISKRNSKRANEQIALTLSTAQISSSNVGSPASLIETQTTNSTEKTIVTPTTPTGGGSARYTSLASLLASTLSTDKQQDVLRIIIPDAAIVSIAGSTSSEITTTTTSTKTTPTPVSISEVTEISEKNSQNLEDYPANSAQKEEETVVKTTSQMLNSSIEAPLGKITDLEEKESLNLTTQTELKVSTEKQQEDTVKELNGENEEVTNKQLLKNINNKVKEKIPKGQFITSSVFDKDIKNETLINSFPTEDSKRGGGGINTDATIKNEKANEESKGFSKKSLMNDGNNSISADNSSDDTELPPPLVVDGECEQVYGLAISRKINESDSVNNKLISLVYQMQPISPKGLEQGKSKEVESLKLASQKDVDVKENKDADKAKRTDSEILRKRSRNEIKIEESTSSGGTLEAVETCSNKKFIFDRQDEELLNKAGVGGVLASVSVELGIPGSPRSSKNYPTHDREHNSSFLDSFDDNIKDFDDSQLKDLLEEAYHYKNPCDKENKSKAFLKLLEKVENEENLYRFCDISHREISSLTARNCSYYGKKSYNYQSLNHPYAHPAQKHQQQLSQNHRLYTQNRSCAGGSLQDLSKQQSQLDCGQSLLAATAGVGNRRAHVNNSGGGGGNTVAAASGNQRARRQKKYSTSVSERQGEGGSLPSNVNSGVVGVCGNSNIKNNSSNNLLLGNGNRGSWKDQRRSALKLVYDPNSTTTSTDTPAETTLAGETVVSSLKDYCSVNNLIEAENCILIVDDTMTDLQERENKQQYSILSTLSSSSLREQESQDAMSREHNYQANVEGGAGGASVGARVPTSRSNLKYILGNGEGNNGIGADENSTYMPASSRSYVDETIHFSSLENANLNFNNIVIDPAMPPGIDSKYLSLDEDYKSCKSILGTIGSGSRRKDNVHKSIDHLYIKTKIHPVVGGSSSSVNSGSGQTITTYNQGTISCNGTVAGCSAFDENANALSELYQNESPHSTTASSTTSSVKTTTTVAATTTTSNGNGKPKSSKKFHDRNTKVLDVASEAGYRGNDNVDDLVKFIESVGGSGKGESRNTNDKKKDRKKDKDKEKDKGKDHKDKNQQKLKKSTSMEELSSGAKLEVHELKRTAATTENNAGLFRSKNNKQNCNKLTSTGTADMNKNLVSKSQAQSIGTGNNVPSCNSNNSNSKHGGGRKVISNTQDLKFVENDQNNANEINVSAPSSQTAAGVEVLSGKERRNKNKDHFNHQQQAELLNCNTKDKSHEKSNHSKQSMRSSVDSSNPSNVVMSCNSSNNNDIVNNNSTMVEDEVSLLNAKQQSSKQEKVDKVDKRRLNCGNPTTNNSNITTATTITSTSNTTVTNNNSITMGRLIPNVLTSSNINNVVDISLVDSVMPESAEFHVVTKKRKAKKPKTANNNAEEIAGGTVNTLRPGAGLPRVQNGPWQPVNITRYNKCNQQQEIAGGSMNNSNTVNGVQSQLNCNGQQQQHYHCGAEHSQAQQLAQRQQPSQQGQAALAARSSVNVNRHYNHHPQSDNCNVNNNGGNKKSRRKSASSVPPSDKSDSSDLDSVHSLPLERRSKTIANISNNSLSISSAAASVTTVTSTRTTVNVKNASSAANSTISSNSLLNGTKNVIDAIVAVTPLTKIVGGTEASVITPAVTMTTASTTSTAVTAAGGNTAISTAAASSNSSVAAKNQQLQNKRNKNSVKTNGTNTPTTNYQNINVAGSNSLASAKTSKSKMAVALANINNVMSPNLATQPISISYADMARSNKTSRVAEVLTSSKAGAGSTLTGQVDISSCGGATTTNETNDNCQVNSSSGEFSKILNNNLTSNYGQNSVITSATEEESSSKTVSKAVKNKKTQIKADFPELGKTLSGANLTATANVVCGGGGGGVTAISGHKTLSYSQRLSTSMIRSVPSMPLNTGSNEMEAPSLECEASSLPALSIAETVTPSGVPEIAMSTSPVSLHSHQQKQSLAKSKCMNRSSTIATSAAKTNAGTAMTGESLPTTSPTSSQSTSSLVNLATVVLMGEQCQGKHLDQQYPALEKTVKRYNTNHSSGSPLSAVTSYNSSTVAAETTSAAQSTTVSSIRDSVPGIKAMSVGRGTGNPLDSTDSTTTSSSTSLSSAAVCVPHASNLAVIELKSNVKSSSSSSNLKNNIIEIESTSTSVYAPKSAVGDAVTRDDRTTGNSSTLIHNSITANMNSSNNHNKYNKVLNNGSALERAPTTSALQSRSATVTMNGGGEEEGEEELATVDHYVAVSSMKPDADLHLSKSDASKTTVATAATACVSRGIAATSAIPEKYDAGSVSKSSKRERQQQQQQRVAKESYKIVNSNISSCNFDKVSNNNSLTAGGKLQLAVGKVTTIRAHLKNELAAAAAGAASTSTLMEMAAKSNKMSKINNNNNSSKPSITSSTSSTVKPSAAAIAEVPVMTTVNHNHNLNNRPAVVILNDDRITSMCESSDVDNDFTFGDFKEDESHLFDEMPSTNENFAMSRQPCVVISHGKNLLKHYQPEQGGNGERRVLLSNKRKLISDSSSAAKMSPDKTECKKALTGDSGGSDASANVDEHGSINSEEATQHRRRLNNSNDQPAIDNVFVAATSSVSYLENNGAYKAGTSKKVSMNVDGSTELQRNSSNNNNNIIGKMTSSPLLPIVNSEDQEQQRCLPPQQQRSTRAYNKSSNKKNNNSKEEEHRAAENLPVTTALEVLSATGVLTNLREVVPPQQLQTCNNVESAMLDEAVIQQQERRRSNAASQHPMANKCKETSCTNLNINNSLINSHNRNSNNNGLMNTCSFPKALHAATISPSSPPSTLSPSLSSPPPAKTVLSKPATTREEEEEDEESESETTPKVNHNSHTNNNRNNYNNHSHKLRNNHNNNNSTNNAGNQGGRQLDDGGHHYIYETYQAPSMSPVSPSLLSTPPPYPTPPPPLPLPALPSATAPAQPHLLTAIPYHRILCQHVHPQQQPQRLLTFNNVPTASTSSYYFHRPSPQVCPGAVGGVSVNHPSIIVNGSNFNVSGVGGAAPHGLVATDGGNIDELILINSKCQVHQQPCSTGVYCPATQLTSQGPTSALQPQQPLPPPPVPPLQQSPSQLILPGAHYGGHPTVATSHGFTASSNNCRAGIGPTNGGNHAYGGLAYGQSNSHLHAQMHGHGFYNGGGLHGHGLAQCHGGHGHTYNGSHHGHGYCYRGQNSHAGGGGGAGHSYGGGVSGVSGHTYPHLHAYAGCGQQGPTYGIVQNQAAYGGNGHQYGSSSSGGGGELGRAHGRANGGVGGLATGHSQHYYRQGGDVSNVGHADQVTNWNEPHPNDHIENIDNDGYGGEYSYSDLDTNELDTTTRPNYIDDETHATEGTAVSAKEEEEEALDDEHSMELMQINENSSYNDAPEIMSSTFDPAAGVGRAETDKQRPSITTSGNEGMKVSASATFVPPKSWTKSSKASQHFNIIVDYISSSWEEVLRSKSTKVYDGK